jgi:flagellar biosynthesis/type III secretory pathway protein FliH
MSLPRARILRAEDITHAAPLFGPGPSASQRRRIAREAIEAQLQAERTVREAQERADAIVAHARDEALAAGADALREVRAEADASLAARWVALREAEGRRFERESDRVLPLAVALAERLVGAALELHPDRIAALAAAVLAEARGARRAVIDAHPADAAALEQHLGGALDPHAYEIRRDDRLARGALRLHTDLGTIDAQLAPRLERLADALRDALR